MTPNILIIMTDQQFAGAMSCAGNPELHTPAMDSLAASGVRFDQAYCTYPVCIPARQSMLTGRMPFELGYRKWGDPIDPRYHDEQLGWLFQKAEYDCVYGGKLHTPGGDPAPHGFRQICEQDDNKLAQACIDYLASEQATEPFLMVASFNNPHSICQWARHEDLPGGNIPDAQIEDCPSLPANFAIPPFEPEVIRQLQHGAPAIYPTVNNTPDDWRHYRNAYYRLIEKVDGEIGKILDTLHPSGYGDNTMIIFTSDHGDGHGAHQWNQKSLLYEECIRVPLIVSFPAQIRTSAVDDQHLVSSGLDMLPTLCDYAGLPAPDGLPGQSLRPLLETGAAPEWRDELVVEAWPFQGDPARTLGRAVLTANHRYIVYGWGRSREQLFDLAADPGEMVSLAASSRCQPILADHRERLRRYCEATGDEFGPHVPGQG